MLKHYYAEIAIWVVTLVGIGLGLTVYEFKNHVFPKKEHKNKDKEQKRD